MEIVDAYEKWEECGRRTPTFLFLFVLFFSFLGLSDYVAVWG